MIDKGAVNKTAFSRSIWDGPKEQEQLDRESETEEDRTTPL